MKKEISRCEMMAVLVKFQKKHPGCLKHPEYYDSLDDKPFNTDDVYWAIKGSKEINDDIRKLVNILFEWKIPSNDPDINSPGRITVSEFCKQYNIPIAVGRTLFKLVNKIMYSAEERRVLT